MSEFKRVNPTAEQRRYVMARDGKRCRYCGCAELVKLHIDHVVPVALGGKTILANLVVACEPCNLRKGAKVWEPTPLGQEWLSELPADTGPKRKPERVRHRPVDHFTAEGRPVYTDKWYPNRLKRGDGHLCSCGERHRVIPGTPAVGARRAGQLDSYGDTSDVPDVPDSALTPKMRERRNKALRRR